MTRLGVIAVHALALPFAALLSLALALAVPGRASGEGIDIHLRDTFFVVAHFHVSAVLAACVAVVTLIAYRYRTLGWPIAASWALLVIHLAVAGLPSHSTFVTVVPSHAGLAFLYVVSAVGGFAAAVLGLLMSLWKALRRSSAV